MTETPSPFSPDVKLFREKLPKVKLYIVTTGTLLLGLVAQFIAFIVLARHLGTTEFGKLMIIMAAMNLAMQVCGISASEAMVRRVARDPTTYPVLLGHNLILTVSSGVVLALIVAVALAFFVEVGDGLIANLTILLILGISSILLYSWLGLVEAIFYARHQYMGANAVNAGFAVWRFVVTIVACYGFGVDRVQTWAFWHFFIHIVGAVGGVALIWRFGRPQWKLLRDELWRGIHLTTPVFFNTLRQNVDVLALSAVADPATIGRYSAAVRIVMTSQVTVSSFDLLLYPQRVIIGQHGVAKAVRFALKYIPVTVGLGLATSVGLFIAAPYVALLFGNDFQGMVPYLQVLCWLLIITPITNSAKDTLVAAEMHAVRGIVYNLGILAGAALIALLTHLYGVSGAITALYISNGLLAIAFWATAFILARDKRKLGQVENRPK